MARGVLLVVLAALALAVNASGTVVELTDDNAAALTAQGTWYIKVRERSERRRRPRRLGEAESL